MNVLQLITGLGMGGAEKVVFDLCKQSRETDHTFIVGVLSNQMDRQADFENSSIPVISFDVSQSISGLRKAMQQLKEVLTEYQIDCIHAHMFHPIILTSAVNFSQARVPVAFTPHNTNIGGKARELFCWITKSLRDVDILFSEQHKQFYNTNKISIIPNGVDYPFFHAYANQPKNERFTFLNIGRLEEQKNQLQLIEEFSKLVANSYDAQLQIVGQGPLFDELQQAIEAHSLQNHVFLLGQRKDIAELFSKAHCFVLPSLWEGNPISVLEAGAVELPVIASKVGNLPELLSDERGVLLNRVNELNGKMVECIKQYQKHKQMGTNLANYIQQNYSLQSVFNQHIQLYQEIISSHE